MLVTLEAVYIYIYIVNISDIKKENKINEKAACFSVPKACGFL